jgi:GTP-binding protein HflX
VWNKIDLLDEETRLGLAARAAQRGDVCLVSATTGEGIDDLRERLSAHLQGTSQTVTFSLHPSDGRRRAWLYGHGRILRETEKGGRIEIEARMTPEQLARWRDL